MYFVISLRISKQPLLFRFWEPAFSDDYYSTGGAVHPQSHQASPVQTNKITSHCHQLTPLVTLLPYFHVLALFLPNWIMQMSTDVLMFYRLLDLRKF